MVEAMLTGIITTRHILRHPLLLIHQFGGVKYLLLLVHALSLHRHHFLNLIT